MSNMVFLIAVLMIVIIVVWSVLNDKVLANDRTKWLLAMKDEGGSNKNNEPDRPFGERRRRPNREV